MRTNLKADTYRRFFQPNLLIVKKLWLFGLFSGDKGDNIDMYVYVDDQNYDQSQSNLHGCQVYFKSRYHTKTMFVRLFPVFFLSLNFTLTDKHSTKNL